MWWAGISSAERAGEGRLRPRCRIFFRKKGIRGGGPEASNLGLPVGGSPGAQLGLTSFPRQMGPRQMGQGFEGLTRPLPGGSRGRGRAHAVEEVSS